MSFLLTDWLIDRVYIASREPDHSESSKKSSASVAIFDAKNRSHIGALKYEKMKHPTGITCYLDTVFVADQDLGAVITFNSTTFGFLGTAVKDLVHPEQVALSQCWRLGLKIWEGIVANQWRKPVKKTSEDLENVLS